MLESRFNPLLNKADNLVRMKSRWIWLVALLVISLSGNTQSQGYSWTFGSAPPFNSTPAIAGSPGTHQLTTIGDGDPAITVVSENIGLGTSCTAPINVGAYPNGGIFGLKFNNSPQFVSNIYTIEMTVKFSPTGNYHRVMGFYDLANPGTAESTSDYGIYITPDADPRLFFYTGGSGSYVGENLINPNTWYHLVFVRDASKIISVYSNGVLQATFNDNADNFLPHAGSGNAITFFKDEGTEEVAGRIAKLSIYNSVLSLTDIQQGFNSICNTTAPIESWNTTGNSGTTASSFIGTKDDQPLIFKANNTEAFRVTSSGQVAIGTANPYTYKLAVGGNIMAEKITVKQLSNWPDYVFDKKYQLPSLKEIEAYLNKNKHLPGIPSAAEVEEKGIDIGDQQAMLLKKIEELTLHLININKQVERLTQENEDLKRGRRARQKKKKIEGTIEKGIK